MPDSSDPRSGAVDVAQLGDLLRTERARSGKTLRQVAAETGVPLTTLSRVESGRLPDLTTFRNIVEWLGVSPDRFFPTPRVRQESTPEVIADVLRRDTALSDDARQQITSVIENLYAAATITARPVRLQLRSARMFTPAAGALLADILERMQESLLAEGKEE